MDLNEIKARFNEYAEKYDNQRRYFIPCYDDFYKRSLSLLKLYRDRFDTVVDLGAGTGLLTKEIYELYPDAAYTLIDISNDMLQIARERFGGLKNFDFIEYNYGDDIPVNHCDLICSGLSIHHLEHTGKEKLYANIYEKLDTNGCFLDLDQFNVRSETINTLYDNWWNQYIDNDVLTLEEKESWRERRKLDREISIQETLELLKNSGFETAECVYNFMKFGVLLAIK